MSHAASPAHPHRFPARLRLKQRREFLRVQKGGRKHHVRNFMVFVAPRTGEAPAGELLPTRCGITVTRKVGKAVVRNRIKRLVREVFRQQRARLPAGLDMVWVAKHQAATASYADVLADFEILLRRGQLARARGPDSHSKPNHNSRQGAGPQRGRR